MLIQPYLLFDGNCGEAFRRYHELLGGDLQMQKMSDAPIPAGEHGDPDMILHARLQVGDAVLMASDAPEDRREAHGSFSVSLTLDTEDEARRVFDGLAEGGTIRLPIGPTFWSPLFGMVLDRFGTAWMVTVPHGA